MTRTKFLLLIILLLVALFVGSWAKRYSASPNSIHSINAKVVGVTDGDTITVLDDNNVQHKVRLLGIDAPERNQAFGTQSKKALSDKIFGKRVNVEWYETDRYKRIIGSIWYDSRWINMEMVQDGMAWHYKQFNKSEFLEDAEIRAKFLKRGLWADANSIPPWEFRKEAKEQRKSK